jgi:hypothetical protein
MRPVLVCSPHPPCVGYLGRVCQGVGVSRARRGQLPSACSCRRALAAVGWVVVPRSEGGFGRVTTDPCRRILKLTAVGSRNLDPSRGWSVSVGAGRRRTITLPPRRGPPAQQRPGPSQQHRRRDGEIMRSTQLHPQDHREPGETRGSSWSRAATTFACHCLCSTTESSSR